ncbi:hypothetical protein A1O1_00401 [Capronia coronata CBS 617.96]|uniref:Uncharacterized protein n=1 Tax=Capronia coronata CBS 617.96 TaxID=1182541 RepID=W9Z126_9EURO|nr:uncharacterized protein A1O1_00401 [Capronia coronata CBS 617.96]EXJ95281.1 hypothetical protein A1O1_00401 [Capronia coronata CBS 617.96]
MAIFRTLRRLRPAGRNNGDATSKLIRELWRISDDLDAYQVQSYKEHARDCRKVKDDPAVPCSNVAQIVNLCDSVNDRLLLPLDDAYKELWLQYAPDPLKPQIQDKSVQQAIEYAIQLCYFVSLRQLRRGPQRLQDVLLHRLYSCTSVGPDLVLKDDFHEKNLTRRAGIKIRYTSDLTNHLQLSGKQLFVFRHGTVLKAYAEDGTRSNVYPPGFLSETQATIDLLFPVSEGRMARRRARLSEKHFADLEVGPLMTQDGEPERNLSRYIFWGHRLAAIDDLYQSSRPSRLKQWYFDRRDKTSFTTFWFALWAFVIAVVFGLISSVTAIMQTWKAFHP